MWRRGVGLAGSDIAGRACRRLRQFDSDFAARDRSILAPFFVGVAHRVNAIRNDGAKSAMGA